jgi:hypothetical protein
MVREKRRLAIIPATELDEERLRSVRSWEPFQVQVHFARTSKLNRWYRGLVGKVADAIDASPDALHAELKFKAGLIEQLIPVYTAGIGSVAVRLKSTAFPAMEDATFSRYVDYAVELLHRDYLPHIRSRFWQRQIIEWAGRRPRLDPQIRPKVA